MSCLNDSVFFDDIYIQRGVRKIFYDKSISDEYVFEYSNSINDRENYCIDTIGVDCFFCVLKEEDDRYKLIGIDKFGYINRLIENNSISFSELNKGYIRLSEFIKEAEYIGREFKRVSPVITYYGDTSIKDSNYFNKYDFDNNKYIVLYMKDNICLVKYMCTYGSGYCIIDCRYIQDGKYKFVGDVYDEFTDRLKVYFDILKQINKIESNDMKRVRRK